MKRKANGQFAAIPVGQKTTKMLEVERILGRSLEEDYHEFYIEKGWGQKRMSHRWQTKRQVIFGSGQNSLRTPWIKRLKLPLRDNTLYEAGMR